MAGARLADVIVEIKGDLAGIKATVDQTKGLFKKFNDDAVAQSARLAQRMNAAYANIGKGLIVASGAMTVALGKISQEAVRFEAAMRNVNSIAQESEKEFKKLESVVARLSVTDGLSQGPSELAEALYEINSAAFTGSDGLKILQASAKAATAGVTSAKVASDGITTALNAYALQAGDAGKVSDLMFRTVDRGKISFEELANNLGKFATIAAQSKISFEESGAALSVLTRRGLSAEEAAIAYRGALLKLQAPTEESAKLAKDLGITLGASALESKGLVGVLEEIDKKTGGSKTALQVLLGDVRAYNGALSLIGEDGGASFRQEIGLFNDSLGATSKAFAEQSKSADQAMKKMIASAQSAAVIIGQTLLPTITAVSDKIRSMTDAFVQATPEQQEFFAKMLKVGTVVAGLVGAVGVAIPALAAMKASFAVLGVVSGTALVGALAATAKAIAITAVVVGGTVKAWQNDFLGLRTEIVPLVKEFSSEVYESLKSLAVYLAPVAKATYDVLADAFLQFDKIARGPFIASMKILAKVVSTTVDAISATVKALTVPLGFVATLLTKGWDEAVEQLKEQGKSLATSLEKLGSSVVSAFGGFFEALIGFGGKLGGLVENVKAELGFASKEFEAFQKRSSDNIVRLLDDSSKSMNAITKTALDTFSTLNQKILTDHKSTFEKLKAEYASFAESAKAAWREISAEAEASSRKSGNSFTSYFGGLVKSGLNYATKSAKTAQEDADRKRLREIADAKSAPGGSDSSASAKTIDPLEARNRKILVDAAKARIGTSQQEINLTAGNANIEAPACAAFGRVLEIDTGINLGSTQNTADLGLHRGTISPYVVGSFFGTDVGEFKTVAEALPGDLVAFQNQVNGVNGALTHMGIIVDRLSDGSLQMIDFSSGQKAISAPRDVQSVSNQGLLIMTPKGLRGENVGNSADKIEKEREKLFKELQEDAKRIFAQANSGDITAAEAYKQVSALYNEAQKGFESGTLEYARVQEELKKVEQAFRDSKLETLSLSRDAGEISRVAFLEGELQVWQEYFSNLKANDEERKQIYANMAQTREELFGARLESVNLNLASGMLGSVDAINQQIKAIETRRSEVKLLEDQKKLTADILALERDKLGIQLEQVEQAATLGGVTRSDVVREQIRLLEQASLNPGTSQDDQLRIASEIAAKKQELFQTELGYIELLSQAGAIGNREALQQTIDRVKEELSVMSGATEGKLELMAQLRDAQEQMFGLDMERITLMKEAGIISDQEELQRHFDLLRSKVEQFRGSEDEKLSLLAQYTAAGNALYAEQNAAADAVYSGIRDSFSGMFESLLSGQASFGDAFKQLWQGIKQAFIQQLSQMIAKVIVFQGLLAGLKTLFGGFLGGLFGGIGGGIGGGTGASLGNLPLFHSGGYVLPNGIGIQPDEVLAKLQVGEVVLSRDQVQQIQNSPGPGSGGGITIGTQVFNGVNDPQQLAFDMGADIRRRYHATLGI